jgi:capsular exopolysaccharide synthesis family protein
MASVSASGRPNTVILRVSAESDNAGEASVLANRLAETMRDYVAKIETPASGGNPLAELTIVNPANSSGAPVSPRVFRNVALGFVAGAVLGGLAIFMRERLNTRVRSASDLEDRVDIPLLGVLPQSKALADNITIDFSQGSDALIEGYRRLRTNLGFVNVDGGNLRLLVTSPAPGDGKTTVAVNLAAALAESGLRVVVVDADLRHPKVARRLLVNNQIGLTTLLRRDAGFGDVVQKTGVSGLEVVAAGPLAPNPAELLISNRAETIFETISSLYDVVVVDSAPVGPVSDAASICRYVDSVLMVARANKTEFSELKAAASQVEKVGGRVAGIVLNGVREIGDSDSYGYYSFPVDSQARTSASATLGDSPTSV